MTVYQINPYYVILLAVPGYTNGDGNEEYLDAGEEARTMDVMTILKIAFVAMLCVPLAYIAYTLVDQLLGQLVRQERRNGAAKPRRKANKRKRG